jgi:hypothetical protein
MVLVILKKYIIRHAVKLKCIHSERNTEVSCHYQLATVIFSDKWDLDIFSEDVAPRPAVGKMNTFGENSSVFIVELCS